MRSPLAVVRKHVRRAHARYRLHRIEWNGRYSCLEPPKGYEHYYTGKQMFPGHDEPIRRSKNIGEFIQRFYRSWRFYIHLRWRPDRHSDMIALEKQLFPQEYAERIRIKQQKQQQKEKEQDEDDEEEKKEDEEVDRVVEKVEGKVSEMVGQLEVEKLRDRWKKEQPVAEQFIRNRAGIVQEAVGEFTSGYKEVIDGTFKLDVDHLVQKLPIDIIDDFEIPEEDNLPLRYEVKPPWEHGSTQQERWQYHEHIEEGEGEQRMEEQTKQQQ